MLARIAGQAKGLADQIVAVAAQNFLRRAVRKANDALAVENDDCLRCFLHEGDLRFAGIRHRDSAGRLVLTQIAPHDGTAEGETKRGGRDDLARKTVFSKGFDRFGLEQRVAHADSNYGCVGPESDDPAQKVECGCAAFADIDNEGVDARFEQGIDPFFGEGKSKIQGASLAGRGKRGELRAKPWRSADHMSEKRGGSMRTGRAARRGGAAHCNARTCQGQTHLCVSNGPQAPLI